MASSVVQSAVQWIGCLLIQEASTLFEVQDKVQALQEELDYMQQFLQDADGKKDERKVWVLIHQIRKLAYDAEDVIDTYILKVQAKTDGSWLTKPACFLYSVCSIYKVGKRIELIQSGMKRVTDKFISYGLRRVSEIEAVGLSHDERYWRKKTQSCAYDDDYADYVVGIENGIPKLLEVLMGEGKRSINVISIVGMGGCGKTTLARKLYNHPYIKECFDCTAWVFVSQEWKTRHVLSEILRKVGGPRETTKLHARMSMEELVDKLHSILKIKSYLVVLDDVWSSEALKEILPALPRGNSNGGSKIIITTRNKEIVEYRELYCSQYTFEPQPLTEEEVWELFSNIALSHCATQNTESFERLAKEMLKKCDGLPLAVVALAGILNTKSSIKQWQQVRETVRSRVMEGTGVGEILTLSYDDLPYHLKPCFLLLGIFPEDCRIPAGMLTRMWIAEGLVATHEEMSPEDVAMQYLEELSHRFLVQLVRTNFKGEIKAVRIHDLLRDLCIKLAKEQSFLDIYNPTSTSITSNASSLGIQTRRAALHSSISFPTGIPNLRSLSVLTRSSILPSAYVSKERLEFKGLFYNFKLLRLLNLWGITTTTGNLPSEVGSLIHLRYLGIRVTNITELPSSIGSLRNLLTLDYRNVESDNDVPIKIPNVFGKLVLLRHLFLPIDRPWSNQDFTLSAMKNLQILSGLKQDGHGNWLSRELSKLSTSLKKLKIAVSTRKQLVMVFSCPSIVSDGLHTLHCELRNGIPLHEVEPISNYQHLHKLVMSGEIQMQLSLILPFNLVMLELKDSMLKDGDPMTALGALSHLKFLRLINTFVGNTLGCEPGSFPQLEELYLAQLKNLNSWKICKGAMPCLKKLHITGCSRLLEFPQGLTFVTTLQDLEFFGMAEEFGKSAVDHGWSERRLRLPHNYESIITQWDSPVDISSISKLYEQLSSGIFLNKKHKKYWVVKQGGFYLNCFMIYAIDLTLSDFDCWELSYMTESDGASIKVAKLQPNEFVLEVSGRFDIAYLSPHMRYNISYILMLKEPEFGWTMPVNCSLNVPGHRGRKHSESLNSKPRNEWIRVLAGEFRTSSENSGEVTFSLRSPLEWPPVLKSGLIVKGVVIEPKL